MSCKQTLVIAGLTVHVYSSQPIDSLSSPVATLFLLHGRQGSMKHLQPIAEYLIQSALEWERDRDLLVVTFDHRNHGIRLVEPLANNSWSSDPDSSNNPRHAIDMYSIQMGTARDVSFLIDFLPSCLFPLEERVVDVWGVAGVSLGGHSTWIALSADPRITIGIPIVGCPDYLKLMSARAREFSIPFQPPHVPLSLLSLIQSSDPVNTLYTSASTSNPFFGKKILVLSGGKDSVVPWSCSKEFVDALEVGEEKGGKKRVVMVEDAGHECTKGMVKEMSEFVREEMLHGLLTCRTASTN